MQIKVAIVGTGSVAQRNYIPFFSKQKDVNLIFFSRTQSKAEECARSFGGNVIGSVRELVAEQPEAVLVLTKETQRFEVSMSILESGHVKRLFFEKPLVAQNGQDKVCEEDFFKARELIQKAKSAGTETAMIFNYRFFEQTRRAKQIIASRNFGKLTQASLLVNYACWSHCIDLLGLFGGRTAEVSALAGNVTYNEAVDVSAAFRLENGATGTIIGTNGTNFKFSLYEIFLCFEKGIIHFSDLDGPMEIFDNERQYSESYRLIGNYSRWDQYNDSFEKSLGAYLDSIRKGEPPPVPGIAGLEELQFEAALRRSIAQKRPVEVQRELPLNI